jgi:hypothetical protein
MYMIAEHPYGVKRHLEVRFTQRSQSVDAAVHRSSQVSALLRQQLLNTSRRRLTFTILIEMLRKSTA